MDLYKLLQFAKYDKPIMSNIAKACLILCSDDSKRINGAVIAVDGGMPIC